MENVEPKKLLEAKQHQESLEAEFIKFLGYTSDRVARIHALTDLWSQTAALGAIIRNNSITTVM